MSPFTRRCEFAERIVADVESNPGSGAFRVDERLRVDEIMLGSDESISTARMAAALDNEFDVVAARHRYHPDVRIIARTDHAEPAKRVLLFDGCPSRQETEWDGRDGRTEWEFRLAVEHVYARLARLRECQIVGRHVRSGAIRDGLAANPLQWQDKSALVTALPCVFNLDGVPNCDPAPLTIALPTGETRDLHVFTYDGDGSAIPWTFARALRYMAWFYRPAEGPVHEGNLFSVTDVYVGLAPDDRIGLAESDPLGRALLRAPESLCCEATNLVEALALIADAAGVHLTPETVNASGQPRTQLRLWSARAGTLRWLALARGGVTADGQPRYDAASKRVDQILAENNTYRAHVIWDHTEVVNAPIVVGDVSRYEMTVALVPGWLPEPNLDNVDPPDRAGAKALALTRDQVEARGAAVTAEPWFRKYHRHGSDFRFHSQVARRWVLNEDGRYDAASYNRNAPFDDYVPFDFSTVADATITTRGAWLRRPRRFEPVITKVVEGHELGVWVEISFDGGTTWHLQASGIRVQSDECAIVFEAENPTEIAPPAVDSRAQNLWYALIDQTFRVRVTAVIESDDRLMHEARPDGTASPTVHVQSRLAYRPDAFQLVSRANTTNVLAGVNAGDARIGRDDRDLAAALVAEMTSALQDRRVYALGAIPWLDTAYAIGDRIAGVRGQGISLASTIGNEAHYPAIVAKRYRFMEEGYETQLVLERSAPKE